MYLYNSKYERVGHLFQERFKNKPIENDEKSFVDDGLIKEILQEQIKEFIESKNEDKFLEWESKIKYTDEKMQQYIKNVSLSHMYDKPTTWY